MFNVCITYDPNENSQMQWDYVLLNFKPDSLYLIGGDKKDIARKSPRSKAVHIKNVSELPRDIPLVVLTPKLGRNIQGTKSLLEFEHPENATYLFGSDIDHLTPKDFKLRSPDHIVYIPVDTDDEMFSYMAAAVTFWDRRVKNG